MYILVYACTVFVSNLFYVKKQTNFVFCILLSLGSKWVTWDICPKSLPECFTKSAFLQLGSLQPFRWLAGVHFVLYFLYTH